MTASAKRTIVVDTANRRAVVDGPFGRRQLEGDWYSKNRDLLLDIAQQQHQLETMSPDDERYDETLHAFRTRVDLFVERYVSL